MNKDKIQIMANQLKSGFSVRPNLVSEELFKDFLETVLLLSSTIIDISYDPFYGHRLEEEFKIIRCSIISVYDNSIEVIKLNGSRTILNIAAIRSIKKASNIDNKTELLISQYINLLKDIDRINKEKEIFLIEYKNNISSKKKELNNHSLLISKAYSKSMGNLSSDDVLDILLNKINKSKNPSLITSTSSIEFFKDQPYRSPNLYNTYAANICSSKKAIRIRRRIKDIGFEEVVAHIMISEGLDMNDLKDMYTLTNYAARYKDDIIENLRVVDAANTVTIRNFLNEYVDFMHFCLSKSHNNIIFKNYLDMDDYGHIYEGLYIYAIKDYIEEERLSKIASDFLNIIDYHNKYIKKYLI